MNTHKLLIMLCMLLAVVESQAATPWFACGNLSQMTIFNRGTIPDRPVNSYEYGIAYNSIEPMPVVVTEWNSGIRVYNREPFLVISDFPDGTMRQGGFMFYAGTLAADDNVCEGAGNLRHRYWWNDTSNVIRTGFTNGCHGTGITVYCRLRN